MLAVAEQSGIYEIVNRETGDRYVGSAVCFRVRFNSHRTALRAGRHHSRHMQASWNKRGIEAFDFRPLFVCARADLLMFEQRGNQFAKGYKHTDEWKAAASARQMGMKRPKSPEHRAKIAATLRGRKVPAEVLAKISATMTGKKRGPYKLKAKA